MLLSNLLRYAKYAAPHALVLLSNYQYVWPNLISK